MWFLGGVILGSVLTILSLMWCRFGGLLRIHYEEESNKPYLFLELNDGPEKMTRRKYVVFRIKIDSRQ